MATPQAADTSVPASLARDSGLRLGGTFIDRPVAKAFLSSAEQPNGAWISRDETFSGWKLIDVQPDQVEVESGGQRIVLPLADPKGGQEPAARTAQAPAVPPQVFRPPMPPIASKAGHGPAGLPPRFQPPAPFQR